MRHLRFLVAMLALAAPIAAAAVEPDLLLIDEVTKDQTTIYIGESRYYLDKASIAPSELDGSTFYTARTVMTRPSQPTATDTIAVVCNHPSLGLALSVRKIGLLTDSSVKYSFDQGPVRSFDQFDMKYLDKGPVTTFSKVALAICKIVGRTTTAVPSNNSFKPNLLRSTKAMAKKLAMALAPLRKSA